MKKYILLFLTITNSCFFLFAQIREPLRRSTEQYCVVCHASWSIGADSATSLIPQLPAYVMVDGKPSRVSNEKLCFSCHTGYISDSRDFFLENDTHKERPNLERIEHGKFPVDSRDQMYCGTCHTPYSSLMVEKTIYKPFLREEIRESRLCLQCHSELAQEPLNHPLNVRITDFPEKPSNPKLAACHKEYLEMLISDHSIVREGFQDYFIDNNTFYVQCSVCQETHKKGFRISYNPVNPGIVMNACPGCHKNQKHLSGIGENSHPLRITFSSNIKMKGCTTDDTTLISCNTCHNPHKWERLKTTLSTVNRRRY